MLLNLRNKEYNHHNCSKIRARYLPWSQKHEQKKEWDVAWQTHPGLAKFSTGCNTAQASNSRAKLLRSRQGASWRFSTNATTPPVSRFKTCNAEESMTDRNKTAGKNKRWEVLYTPLKAQRAAGSSWRWAKSLKCMLQALKLLYDSHLHSWKFLQAGGVT